VEKNTHPVPVSIQVRYGCHPQIKNYPHIRTRQVENWWISDNRTQIAIRLVTNDCLYSLPLLRGERRRSQRRVTGEALGGCQPGGGVDSVLDINEATDKDDHRLGLLPSSSSGTRGRHPPFLGMRALFLHEQTTTEDTARHCEASPVACYAEPPRPPHAALPWLGRAARRPPPSPRLGCLEAPVRCRLPPPLVHHIVRQRDKRKEPLATRVDRKENGKNQRKNVNGKKKEQKVENKKE
jgi:hypothetical protein